MRVYKVQVENNGTTYWYNEEDQLHREGNLPAIEYADGGKSFYINDEYHREDGPAIIWANGIKGWWINGEELTEEEFNNRNKPCLGKKVIIDGIEYTLN